MEAGIRIEFLVLVFGQPWLSRVIDGWLLVLSDGDKNDQNDWNILVVLELFVTETLLAVAVDSEVAAGHFDCNDSFPLLLFFCSSIIACVLL